MRSLLLRRLARHPGLRAALRRGVRRSAAWALRRRSRPYVTLESGGVLIIAPHPDDGTLGCGGLMLLRRMEGLPVRVIYLTDGSASHPGHPKLGPREVAQIRRAEAHTATGRLGVDRAELAFLDVPDGRLDKLDAAQKTAAVDRLAKLIADAAPAELMLPCRRDGSTEHEGGFLLVRSALARCGARPRLLEYPIWAWWNPLRVIPPLLRSRRVWRVDLSGYEAVKRSAIAAYASQTEPTPPWTDPVLPGEFVEAFGGGEEFLFEMEDGCAGS